LIAQGKPEDSAWAICRAQLNEKLKEAKTANVCGTCNWVEDDPKEPRTICPSCGAKAYYVPVLHPTEAFRHRDFQRIHDEFVSYYKQVSKGESEYNDWLKALNLDESQPYAQAQESFQWAKDMITLLREDSNNKYYQVLVGFPLKSMNGNIYKERDLIAAATSLKGSHPSLNHKDDFWFSPESKWGNLEVIDAKYEDGAVEAILKVPKTAICPICNGDKMTELIDKKKILNVSLEGNCTGGTAGVCDGFEFNKKGFSLLTNDVLPGIPLARIKPLENIMVEALHVNETKTEKKKKVIKLEAKIKENKKTDEEIAEIAKKYAEQNIDEDWQSCIDAQLKAGHDQDSAERICGWINANTVRHYPGHQSFNKKEGMKYVGNAEVIMGTPPQFETSGNAEKVVRKDAMSTTDIEGGECPEGYHKNEAGICTKTVPMDMSQTWKTAVGTSPCPEELILKAKEEEKMRRHAETQEKAAEEELSKTQESEKKLTLELHSLQIKCDDQKNLIDKLEKQKEQADRDLVEAKADCETWKRKRDEISGSRDDYKTLSEKLKAALEELQPKYSASISKNLELTKKLTTANEDYLTVSKQLDDTKEALGRAKNEAKKIIRVVP
jgi:hypothetical protein